MRRLPMDDLMGIPNYEYCTEEEMADKIAKCWQLLKVRMPDAPPEVMAAALHSLLGPPHVKPPKKDTKTLPLAAPPEGESSDGKSL